VNFQLPCALKENNQVSQSSQRQFLREARILHTLRHPNLPMVKDYFLIADQGQYLVMDYVEGDDLQTMLDQSVGPLAISQVIQWLCEICEALNYLHSQSPPVIHRDIKPANIKITPQGTAILVDFGISKIYDPDTPTTLGAQAVTPGFSPFEQYGHAPTDARTDIYALGATAYTLLTDQAPPESISRLAGTDLLPPRSLNPAIPPHVEGAILRALQLTPADRYENAKDFCQAITEIEKPDLQNVGTFTPSTVLSSAPATVVIPEEQPVEQDEETSPPLPIQDAVHPTEKQVKRKRRLWKPVFIMLIVLASVVGGYFLWQELSGEPLEMPQIPEAEEPVEDISGEWNGFVEEIGGDHHGYEMFVHFEKDPDSGHLGCHIEARMEPDFIEPRGCEGEFFGRELRMVDEKGQHYWGVLEGERFVGETAWGCFECEPFGVFELYR
jgi:serine/threonine-protein kinase